MIIYKIDILKEIQKKGYTQEEIKKKKILSGGTIDQIRDGKGFSMKTLNNLCVLLRCQPNDIIEILPNDEEKIKFFK